MATAEEERDLLRAELQETRGELELAVVRVMELEGQLAKASAQKEGMRKAGIQEALEGVLADLNEARGRAARETTVVLDGEIKALHRMKDKLNRRLSAPPGPRVRGARPNE